MTRGIWLLDVCIIGFCICGSHENSVVLSAMPKDILENTDVILTCSYTGSLTAGWFHWYSSLNTLPATINGEIETCDVGSSWLANTMLYSYSCINSTVHNLTIRSISRQRHNETWRCEYNLDSLPINSNNLTILIKVPVNSSTISHTTQITASENATISLNCTASQCRPEPKFFWYKGNTSNGDGILLSETVYTSEQTTTIKTYTNSYSINLTRELNDWYIFCAADNVNGNRDPPDGPPSIDNKSINSELMVIQYDYVRLNCSTTGGNPLPVLQWNRNNESSMIINGKTVTKPLSWQASGQISTNLICQSVHLHRNDTIAVAVNILYPPERPTITIKTSSGVFEKVNTMLSVIEGRNFTLNCSAKGNPPVALFAWNHMLPSNSSVMYSAYTRRDKETISCEVSNEMQPSYSSTSVIGNSVSTISVDVLYPPKMNILKGMTIIEGHDLNYTCNFTEGNPNITNITWSRQGINWTGQQLHIRNVSRSQAGVYRCNVSNMMVSSDKTQELGSESSEFALIVQYKTQVLKFVAKNNETDTVTVKENDEVNISCEIEGDPLPSGTLLRQYFIYFLSHTEEVLLYNSTPLTSTQFRLTNTSQAKCINSGLHICRGRNKLHTGEWFTSNKTISLFVNCSPRQSPSFELIQNVTSAINDSATFSFATMAYPAPTFQWYQVINGSKTPEIHGLRGVIHNFSISTNEMQTNFTLYNVEEAHYGEYLLKIENQYGAFNQTFYLVPEGKPIPPAQYGYYQDSISPISVTIWWEPGFDGGLPQSFIISYNLTASTWHNESAISHNKERRMNKTITELASGSAYHVFIYAQNEKGAVRVPHAIIVNTKELALIETISKSKSVGPAVGGAVVGLFAVVTVIVSLIIVRKRSIGKRTRAQNKACDLNDLHTYQNFQNDGHSPSEGSSSALYERLQHADSKSDQQYQQLATFSEEDKKDGPNQRVYENLKLSQQNKENNVGSSGLCQNTSEHTQ